MDESFEKLGEAISLASQAELDDVKENNTLKTFEELVQKLQLQQRLILEGEIQKRKRANFKLNQDISTAEELIEKTHQATVKSEENMQIHMVCQKAIEVSQFSLALQTAEIDYLSRNNADEELAALSVEYMNLCSSNLEKSRKLESINHEIKGVREKISECQLELLSKKTSSEAKLGPNSEEIAKVKARLETLRGRHNFTRYLTQLLLMASEDDLTDPAILDLFLKCGESFDQ